MIGKYKKLKQDFENLERNIQERLPKISTCSTNTII